MDDRTRRAVASHDRHDITFGNRNREEPALVMGCGSAEFEPDNRSVLLGADGRVIFPKRQPFGFSK